MSSEVAHVSMSQRSSHSTIGVVDNVLSSSNREFVGERYLETSKVVWRLTPHTRS
jgi:hypothetical protein